MGNERSSGGHRHAPRRRAEPPGGSELESDKLSTVSARLKTLHAVRLVKRRREAKHIFYALSDAHVLRLVRSAIEHAAEAR